MKIINDIRKEGRKEFMHYSKRPKTEQEQVQLSDRNFCLKSERFSSDFRYFNSLDHSR